jgi:hypothetical protein
MAMAADTHELVSQRYPQYLRDVVVAGRLLQRDGFGATIDHAKTIALRRLHSLVFDRPLRTGLPYPLIRQSLLAGLELRTCNAHEAPAAAPCSPIPLKTLDWAIRGTGIDPKSWHFVDIGSGTGWALQLALRYPFRAITGVEFAYELHQKARSNVAWLTAQGRAKNRSIELRHESALETVLPDGPCILLVFSSFGQIIMQPFLNRIERSVIENPRPIIVLYANPTHPELFERPGIGEIAMIPRYRRLIRFLSPYAVRAYRFGPQN